MLAIFTPKLFEKRVTLLDLPNDFLNKVLLEGDRRAQIKPLLLGFCLFFFFKYKTFIIIFDPEKSTSFH